MPISASLINKIFPFPNLKINKMLVANVIYVFHEPAFKAMLQGVGILRFYLFTSSCFRVWVQLCVKVNLLKKLTF
jgi:hypothetical protein